MKKLLYTGLAALMIMVFSFSASATTMDVNYGSIKNVTFINDHKFYTVGAGEFQVTFEWHEHFDFDIAYCVDLDSEIGKGTYDIDSFHYITEADTNYLRAAWLMDEFASDASSSNQQAGLQLAIWDAIYGNSFTNYSNFQISRFYSEYTDAADDALNMWESLGDTYAIAYSSFNNVKAQDLLVQMDPVPEPGTMLLLGMGIAGLGAAGRKRFRKNNVSGCRS